MNNMENIMGIKRANPEELDDLKKFYYCGVENEKYQPIVTNNRIKKETIEKRLLKKKCIAITGQEGNHLFVGSFVDEKMGAFLPDIKGKLLSAGYTEDQVMEIATIYRSQRIVKRLKVSRTVMEDVILVKGEDEDEDEYNGIIMLMNEEVPSESIGTSTIDSSSV